MKVSKYNIEIQLNGSVYIYNSLRASLSKLSDEEFRSLTQDHFQIEDPQLLSQLEETGILIPDELDELTMIRENMYSSRYNSPYLSLTIAPTADCNFRCSYCYEKGRYENTRMTEKTQNELLEFIRNKIDGKKYFDVCWYGGEPLLALPIIEKLTTEFESMCKDKKVCYSAGMITNGYLLTPDNVAILNRCKIGYIQVTLDGTESVHDRRRFLKNGTGTYNRILGNLKSSYKLLPSVSLRVNIDKQNSAEFKKVYEIIHKFDYDNKINVYPGHVQSIDGCYHQDQCLSNEEYSEFYLLNRFLDDRISLPSRVRQSCTADFCNGFVIGADGLIYRCWDDIGQERLAYSSLNGEISNPDIYYKYLTYDPTLDLKCAECKLLPACMGGCPRIAIDQNIEKKCTPYKYVMNQYLYRLIEDIENEKKTT